MGEEADAGAAASSALFLFLPCVWRVMRLTQGIEKGQVQVQQEQQQGALAYVRVM